MKLIVGKNCIPCKQVKSWLSSNNIEIDTVVAQDNMDEVKALGVKSLPTLVLDDNTLIKGEEDIVKFFEDRK